MNVIFMVNLATRDHWEPEQIREQILLSNNNGTCYLPFIETIDGVEKALNQQNVCYMHRNLVVLEAISKEAILMALKWHYPNESYLYWWIASEKSVEEFKTQADFWEEHDLGGE
jgi:hypothetical protein